MNQEHVSAIKKRQKKWLTPSKLGRTLLFLFLSLSIIPVALISWVSHHTAYQSLNKDAQLALQIIAKLKTQQITAYFSQIITDLNAQAAAISNLNLLEKLIRAHQDSNLPLPAFIKSLTWPHLISQQGVDLKTYRKTYNYLDIFLIDVAGNIQFTAAGERDTGTNILTGPYSGTLFANACRTSFATRQPAFSDFFRYPPSGNRISAFLTAPIVNPQNHVIGLIAFQISLDAVNAIMRETLNLGKTTDTYLLGKDLRIRSDSILDADKTALTHTVSTLPAISWRNTPSSTARPPREYNEVTLYKGLHGKTVLGTHLDFKILNVPLAVFTEIEKKEAFAAALALRQIILLLLTITALTIFSIAVYISLRIVRPLRILSKGAHRVAKGDLVHEIEVTTKNELGELAANFNNMIAHLRVTLDTNKAQNWLMIGQTQLHEKMRGEPDIDTLANNIIRFLAQYLHAQVGTLYMTDELERLRMVGSYAYTRKKNQKKNAPLFIQPGEGLVGQTATTQEPIIITDCPTDYIQIHSGLGQATPKNILLFPIILGNQVNGVVELASFQKITDTHLNFLKQVSDSIAIALHSVASRHKTAELLERTQQQSEELQVQQEELRQTNEELEEKSNRLEIQKRDTERKNEELRAARKMLEEKARDLEVSSRYKSEFLSNMSHELRTPLNNILLLARLLADNKSGSLSIDQMDSARSIYTSGTELLHLINEVLDLSKVEAGKMELRVEEVELRELARSIARHFQHLPHQKSLSFKTIVDPDLPHTIHTDRQRVEQVVKNFLSNAFKFTEEGSITLHLYRPDPATPDEITVLGTLLESQPAIAISVTDTGGGIPKEKQRIVFEAFQQVDGTTSRKYGGTGLGLSISKELAKLMGGEIRMKSTLGAGSTFTFIFPQTCQTTPQKEAEIILPQAATQTGPEPQQDIVKPSTLPTPLDTAEEVEDDRKTISPKDKSILIIEDDPRFLKMLRDLSKQHDFKCLVAGNGETGLLFAEYYMPSAIILDIGLPRIDGWSVMTRLKENPRTRHIPVHFISGFDKESEAMRMGAVSFHTKPVSPDDLEQIYQRLNKMISKSVKDLLVVEDNTEQANSIATLMSSPDIKTTIANTAKEALALACSGDFDCMILDIGLPDMSGIQLLEKIKENENIDHLPIIIYTGRSLTKKEQKIIDRYAGATILKGAGSDQKLLAETSLFLHRVQTNLPEEHQRLLRMIYDKEAILAHKMVLVVDDDMRNVYSLKKNLEEKEMKVFVGRNGDEGLKILNTTPGIDVILMDIMMPEMDGYEAIRAIRKQHRFKDIPIIALTAKAMKGDRARCIEVGASDYLAKPVDTDRLFSMLRVWLY